MFKKGLIIFFTILLFFTGITSDTAKAKTDTVLEIIEMQKSIKSLRAEFIQEKHSELLDKPIITRGTFFYLSPDKFVWDYEEGIKVTTDGKNVMIFYKDLGEAEMGELSRFPSLPGDFSVEKLREKYRIDVIISEKNQYILNIRPVISESIIKEIILTLDEKGIPVEVRITERTKDNTVIKFMKKDINRKLPDDIFSMKVPEGVRIRNLSK